MYNARLIVMSADRPAFLKKAAFSLRKEAGW